jgi:hypothetical protein
LVVATDMAASEVEENSEEVTSGSVYTPCPHEQFITSSVSIKLLTVHKLTQKILYVQCRMWFINPLKPSGNYMYHLL